MYRKVKKIVPIGLAEREAYALVTARQWRSTVKSKAQVKRRARGVKYLNIPDEKRIPMVRIKRWDRWQFPSEKLRVNLAQYGVEEYRYYMPPKLPKAYPSKETKQKLREAQEKRKILDSDAPRVIADFLLSLTRIDKIDDIL